MHTIVKPIHNSLKRSKIPGIQFQVLMRKTKLNDWLKDERLSNRLSGTVRKNASIGFKVGSQLEHEAICQALGWGFESCASTRINYNDAISEGDCPSITEVGWHFDRLLQIKLFPEDYFELKYIIVQDEAGHFTRQGVGIIVRETSIQWVKSGKLIFALLIEYDLKTETWSDCINPF